RNGAEYAVKLDGVLGEFRTALQEEIQAARAFESSNAVQLRNGRRIAKIGKNFQYLFEIENALNLPGDTPGDLLIPDNPPINVIIVSIEGLAITISIPEDIGSFVPIARLKSNLTYLMIRLIERIEAYANKSNPVGDRIRGVHSITGSEPEIKFTELYNDYQKSAIASSVGRDTTFIWGPPGTGKTQTIGEIGFQLYKRKRSILLVSHTNTAVDQAIMRIGKKIHKDDLEKGKAIRVGDPKDERLRKYPNLLLETHVEKRSEELANKRDKLKNELEKGSSESIELARLIDLCEWVKSSKASIQIMADNLQEIQKVENEIILLKGQLSQALKNRAFWQEAITKAKQINEIIRNKNRIDNDIQDIKNQINKLEELLDNRANEISEEKKILSEAKSVGWLTRRWKGLPQPEDQEEKIGRLEREYGGHGIQLDHKRNDLLELQLERGRIIQAINSFQQKFGGSPEDVQRKASKNESLIKELTQKIQKQKKSANSDRLKLEHILKQKITVLNDGQLIGGVSKTAEAMLDAVIEAYEWAKIKVAGQDFNSLKAKLENLNDQIAQFEIEIFEIEEQLKKVEETIISEADIVATTLTRAYLRESIQSRRFDTVILDEASMAPIPALWIAAGLADKNAVVVGDPKQLPPIVISDKKLAKKWLGTDIFKEAGLTDYNMKVQHLAPLWMQYRMHPSISLIANNLVYNKRLKDGKIIVGNDYYELSDTKCDSGLLSWYYQDWGYDNPVLLIDTGTLDAWVTSVSRGKRSSRLNFLSATICVDLAERVLKDDRPELKPGKSARIIIISPYRPHARLVEILIKEQGLQNEVRSGTIHNFQGSEADLVIFDLVNDEPHFRVGMFIPALDEDMKRLINVALTRAKRRLFVVGDFDYIKKLAKKAFVGAQLIPFLKDHFPCVDARSVVPCGLAARSTEAQSKVFGGKVEPDADRIIMTQDRFYPFFCGDIHQAKERVVIYSAFITQDRLAIMEPSIKSVVERGVRVFVITKARGDRGKRELNTYRMLESTLEKWGVVVIHKRRMHEKIAIIDNSILWMGSLNVLSFSSTQEIMERRCSKNVVEDFMKTLRLLELLNEYEDGNPTCPICKSEVVASEGKNDPYYWRCVIDGCYSRSIDQPPIKSGTITCSNCGGRVEYGEWGGKPHWRCIENRKHRQKIAKTHLMLPEMRKIIPNRELKKIEKDFGIKKQQSPVNKSRQISLFD
ncbi:ATP-binding domain-containing protein, partial [candidate division WOR-3 bacterium]|nr:ATP-binding domain-containing protein [candidate division WOR-3 bacterium]